MLHPAPEDSRVVSVRLPTTLVQRLDRLLDWHTTHRRRPTTRNAALRAALGEWLDQHEQLAGLLDPESLRQQFRAAYDSQRPSSDGVPIHRLRHLLQWPRERFDVSPQKFEAERPCPDGLPQGRKVGIIARGLHPSLSWSQRRYA